jgi:Leucine-rich repeat (LRR) protein
MVPTQLMDATHITVLDLSQNQLTTLPNWFCDTLISLTTLNLSHNFFFDLPEKFGDMKRLKVCFQNLNFLHC